MANETTEQIASRILSGISKDVPEIAAPSTPKVDLSPGEDEDPWNPFNAEYRDALIRPLKTFVVQGLSGKQLQLLQSQLKRFPGAIARTHVTAIAAGEEPEPPINIAAKAWKGTKQSLLYMLEQLDRPQDSLFSVIENMLQGQQDPAKYWADAKANWTGQDITNFEDVLDELPPGILDSMANAAWNIQKFATNPTAPFKEGAWERIAEEDPVSREDGLKFWGFVGDIAIDPLFLLGGVGAATAKGAKAVGTATKAGRALQAASFVDPGRTLGAGLRGLGRGTGFVIRQSPTLEKAMRQTIWRGTGHKELDKLINKIADVAPGLSRTTREAYDDMARFVNQPALRDVPIVELAEEHKGIDVILDLIDRAGTGQALKNADFNNPNAVRSLLGIDPQKRELVRTAIKKARLAFDYEQQARIAAGQTVPNFKKDMLRLQARTDKEAQAAFIDAVSTQLDLTRSQHGELVKSLTTGIAATNIKKLLGQRSLKNIAKSKGTPDALAIGAEFKNNFMDSIVRMMEGGTDTASAIERLGNMDALIMTRSILGGERLVKALNRSRDISQAIDFLPEYVPHIASESALFRMSQLGRDAKAGLKKAMQDARTRSDLHRQWRDKATGRPLSFEEIENTIKAGEARLTGGGPLLAKEALPKRAARAAADIWIDEKPRDFVGKSVRKIIGPRAVAKFMDTDPLAIFAIQSQRTARSITASGYANGIRRRFTTAAGELNELSTKERAIREGMKVPTVFSKIAGHQALTARHPELLNRIVDEKLGNAIVRASRPFLAEPSAGLARFADVMKRWWIAYTLPIYPAYHFRNAMSNKMLMNFAGWMDNPTQWGPDISDAIRSSKLQLHAMRNNYKAMRGEKFFAKYYNAEWDGYKLHKVAQHTGVTNAGFFGQEIADLFRAANPEKNWTRFAPGHPNFGMVTKGRRVGEWIEQGDRLTLFAHRLRNGDTTEQASATVKKFLGNFSGEIMTPFEREVATRVMPFYRWTRFNVPLQLDQIAFSPKSRFKLTTLRRLHEAFIEPEGFQHGQIPEWTPDYIHELSGGVAGFDPATGRARFMALENFIPAADLSNFMGNPEGTLVDKLGVSSMLRFILQQTAPPLQLGVSLAMRTPTFGAAEPFTGSRELLGQEFSAQTNHVLRNFRFLTAFDKADPLGIWHRKRELSPWRERLLRTLTGFTMYRTTPMTHILNMREDQIRELNKKRGGFSSARRIKNVLDYEKRMAKVLKVPKDLLRMLGLAEEEAERLDLDDPYPVGTAFEDDWLREKEIAVVRDPRKEIEKGR